LDGGLVVFWSLKCVGMNVGEGRRMVGDQGVKETEEVLGNPLDCGKLCCRHRKEELGGWGSGMKKGGLAKLGCMKWLSFLTMPHCILPKS